MENEECGSIWRAKIDTRAPFQSVKEAVMIFGERVLAGEVYANKLNQIRAAEMKEEEHTNHPSSAVTELEETNQNLKRVREESQMMANCLTALKEELERTKMELIELKAKESNQQFDDSEAEDIKFVENAQEVQVINELPVNKKEPEFQKKRSVKFANPPIQMMNSDESRAVLGREFSADRVSSKNISVDKEASGRTRKRKKKKKKFMPMIAAVFSKKKGVSYA